MKPSPPTTRPLAGLRLASKALLGLWVVASAGGCASQAELARQLRAAARPENMPAVVACWERAFERAGFRGRYLATVDFTVAADGDLEDVAIRSFVDQNSGDEVTAADEADDLRSCVHDALTSVRLPGLDLGKDLPVEGYRIAFDDASQQARADASERAANVLIGPRADRCDGLYGHEPPRAATVLHAEIEDAKAEGRSAGEADRDRRARALQRQYDLALELGERLEADANQADLSREARERYRGELDRAREMARSVGAEIGCEPPRRLR